MGFGAALLVERRNRQHADRERAHEREMRTKDVNDLIHSEIQRNQNELTKLREELTRPELPTSAPSSTIWQSLSAEYLANAREPLLPEFYADLARTERLLLAYRTQLQQGGAAIATARQTILPRLRSAVDEQLSSGASLTKSFTE